MKSLTSKLLKCRSFGHCIVFWTRTSPKKTIKMAFFYYRLGVMLYRCLLPLPQAGCHFRIDSLSCVEVEPDQHGRRGAALKIYLMPQSRKYYGFKGFTVTRATHGENDCSYGPARCGAEKVYQTLCSHVK